MWIHQIDYIIIIILQYYIISKIAKFYFLYVYRNYKLLFTRGSFESIFEYNHNLLLYILE